MLHQKSLFTWLYFFVFIPNVPKIQHTMNQLVNRKCEMMGFYFNTTLNPLLQTWSVSCGCAFVCLLVQAYVLP